MQGLFVENENGIFKRPRFKKDVKTAVAEGRLIETEATSVFGNEYAGYISDAPDGTVIQFVGPDPYNRRNFYGTLVKTASGVTVK